MFRPDFSTSSDVEYTYNEEKGKIYYIIYNFLLDFIVVTVGLFGI